MEFERLVREAAAKTPIPDSRILWPAQYRHPTAARGRPCISRSTVRSGQRLGCMGHAGHHHHLRRFGLRRCRLPQYRRRCHRQGRRHQRRLQRHGRRHGCMIGGSIGARGLTMTKWNPDYTRPEMWVLGSVGDTFAEFNCGGIGVVCGVEPEEPGQCPRLPPLRRHGWRLDLLPRHDRRLLSRKPTPSWIQPDDAAVAVADRAVCPNFYGKIGKANLLTSLDPCARNGRCWWPSPRRSGR